jgi:predicted permease
MTAAVFARLLAIFIAVGLGWVVGRMRWLGAGGAAGDPSRVLGNAAFYLFIPALLFRTTARVDLAALPWRLLAAFFLPVLALLFAVYLLQRRGKAEPGAVAAPSVRAITVSFGNTVQVGIPMAHAMFGEAGLALHITVVSVHALVLLSVLTVLVELDLARARARSRHGPAGLRAMLALTLRNTIVHPVMLPVLAGLAWNLSGWPLPAVLDEVLVLLGSAVVPLCLVLIGMSLAYAGITPRWRSALLLVVVKLALLPALVLVVAHVGFGLEGMPLSVLVMIAALPVGSNALIFSQRYETLEDETSTAIVISTLAFVATAPAWLSLLSALSAPAP